MEEGDKLRKWQEDSLFNYISKMIHEFRRFQEAQ